MRRQPFTQLVDRLAVIRPLHQSLALGASQGTPVAQLELHASEIQLAAHGHGNAAQIAGEIRLKIKAVTIQIRHLGTGGC